MAQAMSELLPDDDPRAFSVAGRVLLVALAEAAEADRTLRTARGVGTHGGWVSDETAPYSVRHATPEDIARLLAARQAADKRALSARAALTRALAASEQRTRRYGDGN